MQGHLGQGSTCNSFRNPTIGSEQLAYLTGSARAQAKSPRSRTGQARECMVAANETVPGRPGSRDKSDRKAREEPSQATDRLQPEPRPALDPPPSRASSGQTPCNNLAKVREEAAAIAKPSFAPGPCPGRSFASACSSSVDE